MKLSRLEMLRRIRGMEILEGDVLDLNNWVQEEGVGAFNIDDNGVCFEDVEGLSKDQIKKVYEDEYIYETSSKEEANQNLKKEMFYWLNLGFLQSVRDSMETKGQISKEDILAWNEALDVEINKELSKEKDLQEENLRIESLVKRLEGYPKAIEGFKIAKATWGKDLQNFTFYEYVKQYEYELSAYYLK